MIAILSDIHGNLEALDAVLCDIRKQEVDSIYCLGDLVGYGPDPLPCIELAMNWKIVLQGHCDKSSLGSDDLPEFAAARHARKTILRFREQLWSHPKRDAIRQFMADRPVRFADSDAQFVHGTLRDPLNEYLFPESIYDHTKMNAIGKLVESLCFCGHSHIAGVFSFKDENRWDYLSQNEIDGHYSVPKSKTICNVGSVGQPRDEDINACYVLWDRQSIKFRRIPYDIDRTIAKIKADCDDDIDGDRYRYGR